VKLIVLTIFALGCAPEIVGPRDTGLEGLAVTKVDPGLILPGTKIVIVGQSFVPETLGQTQVRLHGVVGGSGDVDVELDVVPISGSRIELSATDALFAGLGSTGAFDGEVVVEVTSTVDKKLHTAGLTVSLRFENSSTPKLDAVGDQISFVNQPTEVSGNGFLLGGDEGTTEAELTGCFTPTGQTTCGAMKTLRIPATPKAAFDRTRVTFPYVTAISGIGPGSFDGSVVMINVHRSTEEERSIEKAVHFDIQKPAIFGASTTSASLGQYVIINGGGFVGGNAEEATLLDLKGTFTPDDGSPDIDLDLELVPEFVSGPTVRYVLSETDALGKLIDLRKQSGLIVGTAQPIVSDASGRVSGDPIMVGLLVLPVKQIVYVRFLPSYVESLRKFGLRAADPLIRSRVLQVAARDYGGINVEFRTTEPEDFALFATVDLAGPDPNGQGLLGYDNTPGKDTDNLRLYDHIGGVNALTQEDGSPGYGGVFVEGFFGFSMHPNGLAARLPEDPPNQTFDPVFDPFRPDAGGLEVTAGELAQLQPPMLTDGSSCPAPSSDRRGRISCAIWVLGSIIGSTMTHEVGHSLGLANPYGDGYHDPGDLPNRLMDVGGARPFDERAELNGLGPSRFCDSAFDYLRMILPSTADKPAIDRPTCE
jgi:hypothetical protein